MFKDSFLRTSEVKQNNNASDFSVLEKDESFNNRGAREGISSGTLDKEFLRDRSEENLEMLRGVGEDARFLKGFYKEIIDKYPELSCVELKDAPELKFRSSQSKGTQDDLHLSIKYNFSSPLEAYSAPKKNEKLEESECTFAEDYVENLKILEKRLSAKEGDVTQNGRLASALVFLHEMGHAYDFLHNYLKVKPEEFREGVEIKRISEAIKQVARETKRDKASLPVPEFLEDGVQERESRQKYLEEYRNMRREKFADEFACKFILEKIADRNTRT